MNPTYSRPHFQSMPQSIGNDSNLQPSRRESPFQATKNGYFATLSEAKQFEANFSSKNSKYTYAAMALAAGACAAYYTDSSSVLSIGLVIAALSVLSMRNQMSDEDVSKVSNLKDRLIEEKSVLAQLIPHCSDSEYKDFIDEALGHGVLERYRGSIRNYPEMIRFGAALPDLNANRLIQFLSTCDHPVAFIGPMALAAKATGREMPAALGIYLKNHPDLMEDAVIWYGAYTAKQNNPSFGQLPLARQMELVFNSLRDGLEGGPQNSFAAGD